MSIENQTTPEEIPANLPESIVTLRAARMDFAIERGKVLFKLSSDIQLADCTLQLLKAICKTLESNECVPYPISFDTYKNSEATEKSCRSFPAASCFSPTRGAGAACKQLRLFHRRASHTA